MDLKVLEEARNGNLDARNAFIEENKNKIYRYTCFICRRILKWENDDELSIALIAFNSAIDTFDSGNFSSYAKIVIKNKLIDYFRKNSKHKSCINLDDDIVQNIDFKNDSIENKMDRAAEIKVLSSLLQGFNISFEILTTNSPKHSDTRNSLIKMCRVLSKNKEIIKLLLNKHTLPIKEILDTYNVSRKTLEKWRRYIIAVLIVFEDDRLENIKSFIDNGRRWAYENRYCFRNS